MELEQSCLRPEHDEVESTDREGKTDRRLQKSMVVSFFFELIPWVFMREVIGMRNTASSECLKNYRFFHIDD